MSYPVDAMRESFFKQKNSPSNFEDEDLFDMGYSFEEISKIKGGK